MVSPPSFCPLHADRFPGSTPLAALQSIDARTRQAFSQLRLRDEGLSLELAARLRVLGKGLAAACRSAKGGYRTGTAGLAAYANLRRQFAHFFATQARGEHAGNQPLAAIGLYLLDVLPMNLENCSRSGPCRIEIIEAAIALLSENGRDNESAAGRERKQTIFPGGYGG